MNENDKFKITIRVADIPEFKLKVGRDEEEYYRIASTELNKLWSNWKTTVVNNDSPTLLAVIALRFSVQFYKALDQFKKANENNSQIQEEVNVVLEDFEKELDKILLDVK